MVISKSDYMLFLHQPAWLWLKKNQPSKLPPVDAATQAMFDAGHAFEAYAEALFDGGMTIGWDKNDWGSYRTLPTRTLQALEDGAKIIFQGRFEWCEFTFLPDIIEVVGHKTLDLYEIKSSTGVKPDHLYDLAFQKVVLEKLGYAVRHCAVIHVNNQYVRQGEIDPRQLTKVSDVTERVDEIALKTPDYMQAALKVAAQTDMPDPDPALAKLGSKANWTKIYQHIFPPTPKVWPKDIQPTINHAEIMRFLNGLTYPLYFFDYETMQGLVPYFDGQKPYQQVPFQYSLHIIRAPGGKVEHTEYLQSDATNPAPRVAEQLVKDMGSSGSIITWNMSFEKSVNTDLVRMFPQYNEQIVAINERVVDLMTPFKAKWYDDPRCEGSASIKKVLPVVCPDLSYDDLDIKDGNAAQRLWMQAVLDETRDDKATILANLRTYCQLDTWAMVRIWQELEKLR